MSSSKQSTDSGSVEIILESQQVPEVEFSDWNELAMGILLRIPSSLLCEITGGNVAHKRKTDGAVKEVIDQYKQRERTQPSIYLQILADKNDLSPSPNILTKVIGRLRSYVTDYQYAYKVDSIKGKGTNIESSKRGARRYLKTAASPLPSDTRIIRKLRHFCDKLEARLSGVRP